MYEYKQQTQKQKLFCLSFHPHLSPTLLLHAQAGVSVTRQGLNPLHHKKELFIKWWNKKQK